MGHNANFSRRRSEREQFWQQLTREQGQARDAKPLFISIVLFGIIIGGIARRASAGEWSGDTSGQGRPNVVLVLTDTAEARTGE